MLQKIWPTPYKVKKGDLVSFLIQLIIFIIVCAVIGWVIGFVASLPIINIFGWILTIIKFLCYYYPTLKKLKAKCAAAQ